MFSRHSFLSMAAAAPLHSTKKHSEKFHDKTRYHCGYRQTHFNLLLTAKKMRPFWGVTVIDGFEWMGPLAPEKRG